MGVGVFLAIALIGLSQSLTGAISGATIGAIAALAFLLVSLITALTGLISVA